ncbi:MAG: hypothetical protein EXR99_00490 [Gemmataceae bacterium]|nr:hypothetical protein [Gemmataceae bacterium]
MKTQPSLGNWSRRKFLAASSAGLGLAWTPILKAQEIPPPAKAGYQGPKVFLIRFGGGVRRKETISYPDKTFCPFLLHEMAGNHGTFLPNVSIASSPDIITSHGQGTLQILTGRYDKYQDISNKFLGERFVPPAPTLFEYFRKNFQVESHESLLINGEDRLQEEFFSFSETPGYGVDYRCQVLSLYRFKLWLAQRDLDLAKGNTHQENAAKKLAELKEKNYRDPEGKLPGTQALNSFWESWHKEYGNTGFINPRGDRLITELAIQAMNKLHPKLVMINYNDPDYVHWGPPAFYTRAISIIDDCVKRLWQSTQANEEYRNQTVFAVIPDCGRDDNRACSIPFQHHFGGKSSREIFAILSGPGIPKGARIDKPYDQIDLAPTLGKLMGFPLSLVQGKTIPGVIS